MLTFIFVVVLVLAVLAAGVYYIVFTLRGPQGKAGKPETPKQAALSTVVAPAVWSVPDTLAGLSEASTRRSMRIPADAFNWIDAHQTPLGVWLRVAGTDRAIRVTRSDDGQTLTVERVTALAYILRDKTAPLEVEVSILSQELSSAKQTTATLDVHSEGGQLVVASVGDALVKASGPSFPLPANGVHGVVRDVERAEPFVVEE